MPIETQIIPEPVLESIIKETQEMKGRSDRSKRVWIIHGRNKELAESVFSFLRAIGLGPIEWSEARARTGVSSPYIGEILKAGFDYAQAFVVLLTGDDEAKLRTEDATLIKSFLSGKGTFVHSVTFREYIS